MGTLSMVVEDIQASHPGVPNFIRGDSNVNPNHTTRPRIMQEFLDRYDLSSLHLGHNTYHHFTGNSRSDSQLDVLISSPGHPDILDEIIWKVENPLITSSHDLIVSSFKLTPKAHNSQETPKAPRVTTQMHRHMG